MIKKLFGHSVVYGFTGVASSFAAIFLVPVYTRILSPADYGITAIVVTFTGIIGVIYNLGLSSAIFWAYFRATSEEERKKVVGTALLFQVLFGLFLTLLLLAFSSRINNILFPQSQPDIFLRLGVLTIFFQSGLSLPLAVLRAKEKPFSYITISLSSLLLNIAIAVLLVVILRIGVIGVFLANLGANLVIYTVSVALILKSTKLVISKSWLRGMLSYGLPMVPAGLAMWVLNSSDRYFLNYFVGLDQVGIYNVGYRVGSLITLIIGAVQLAYAPFMFSMASRADAKDIYSRFATYYFLLLAFVSLGLSLFSKEVVQILTGDKFHSAYIIVPIIAFSYVAYGMYSNFATGVSITKKPIFSSISALIAGGINLVLNLTLISKYGGIGAALSTLVSFFFSSI